MSSAKSRKRTANGVVKAKSAAGEVIRRSDPNGKVVNFPSNIDGDHNGDFNGAQYLPSSKPNKTARTKDRALRLQPARQGLPIYAHADHVRQKLRDHDVLLVVGETGSGKSTQVPQFLINEAWCKKQKIRAGANQGANVGGCIAITQPRRVAAISLARRVAEEMGTPLGNSSPASQVGYSVRFENNTSPSTHIKFLTEGMLLQEMLRDPWLKEYSAIVVDEVHERGVNVDVVLGFLKRMQDLRDEKDGRGGVPMKVVVMSATADMEKIEGFFNMKQSNKEGAVLKTNGDDEWLGFSDDEYASAGPMAAMTVAASSLFIKGRQFPVNIDYTPIPVSDVLDAAYQRILQIHAHAPLPGDVLVFLTGQETVESLLNLLTSWSHTLQKESKQSQALPRLLLLPLYAALPSNLQQRVFQPTPKFARKIILATNIAETSITVPGIKYVVDTGKAKQRLFRPSLNLDTLLTVPISRSSASQRSGRAGRDAPGTAYRLYTETDFYQLAQDTGPEILRCDLSQLVLTLKSHSIDDLRTFPFLTAPPRRALERAMIHLLQLSALDNSTGKITDLGREMGVLPLPASLARVLLASAEPAYCCVNEIVNIVSALSVENIFLNVHNRISSSKTNDPLKIASKSSVDNDNSGLEDESFETLAQKARRQLFRREGDHLTLLATMQAYASENTDRRRWCEQRHISHRAISGAMDVRKQLTALLERYQARSKSQNKNHKPGEAQARMLDPSVPDHDTTTLPSRILKCMLTGFHPNVARLSADGSYRTMLTNQPVAIHPSSVLFSVPSQASGDERGGGKAQPRKFEGIMYNEFVYTGTKAYARGVSAIELSWLAS